MTGLTSFSNSATRTRPGGSRYEAGAARRKAAADGREPERCKPRSTMRVHGPLNLAPTLVTRRAVRIRSSRGRAPCGRRGMQPSFALRPRAQTPPPPPRLRPRSCLRTPGPGTRRSSRETSRWPASELWQGPIRPPASTSSGCTGAGPGVVQFRTRSLAGRWSEWVDADAEPEDQPNAGSAERTRTRSWRLGAPWWVGPSNRIEYRLRGRVDAAAGVLRLELAGRRAGPDAPEGRRAADHAAQRLAGRRVDPAGRPVLRPRFEDGDRPSHGRLERLLTGRGSGDRQGNRDLPREGKRLERHRLQLPRRPLRPGLRRPVRRDRTERDRRARAGLQHRLGRRLRDRRVQLARRSPARRATRSSACSPGGSTSPTSTRRRRSRTSPAAIPATPPASQSSSGRSPAHRDTGLTDCPGNRLYGILNSIAGDVSRIGLPKLYAPTVTGTVPGLVRFRARLSSPLPWTIDVLDAAGSTVAATSGLGSTLDWTWDASFVPPGLVHVRDPQRRRPHACGRNDRLGRARACALAASSPILPVVTPNGDGVADTATISYSLTVPAVVTAVVRDSLGEGVATLPQGWKRAAPQKLRLRPGRAAGRDLRGRAHGAGDRRPHGVPPRSQVSVTRTLGRVSATRVAFSPNGDGRADRIAFRFELACPADVRLRILKEGKWVADARRRPARAGPADGRVGRREAVRPAARRRLRRRRSR